LHVLEPNYGDDPDGKTDYGNPYLFIGRRVDMLDNGSLTIQYKRNRYYDYYTGHWTTHDPFGLEADATERNVFGLIRQYTDGLNLYEYARENPLRYVDSNGTLTTPLCIAQVAWAVKKSKGTNDKYRHCYVGCKISYYCGL